MGSALAGIAAALALALTGTVAGLFFGFSVAVMPALDAIQAEQAIRAMQSINRRILNPVFLTSFLVAPLAAVLAGVLLLTIGRTPAALLFFLAGAIYILGAVVPTGVVNVPMNNALDAVGPAAERNEVEAARLWPGYSSRWTRWNTLRTAFSTASLLLDGLAIFAWGREW